MVVCRRSIRWSRKAELKLKRRWKPALLYSYNAFETGLPACVDRHRSVAYAPRCMNLKPNSALRRLLAFV